MTAASDAISDEASGNRKTNRKRITAPPDPAPAFGGAYGSFHMEVA